MRNKKTIIAAASLIIIALLIGTAIIPVFAGSLILNDAEKVEAKSASGAESASQIVSEPERVEPEPTVLEPETVVADEGCSACGDYIQPTEITGGSNPEEIVGQPQEPPVDPCYPCFIAIPLGLEDAKEILSDSFPKISDYEKTLGWGLLYIDDVISWFASIGPTIKTCIGEYGYELGENFGKALGNATEEVIDILEIAWEFYKAGDIKYFVLTMVFSPLYILPVFFATLLTDFIELCFGDNGGGGDDPGNGGLETVTGQSTLETIET